MKLWTFSQNVPLPFCAPQFGSEMTFLFGHSTQNCTVYNRFCTLCLISGGENGLAL